LRAEVRVLGREPACGGPVCGRETPRRPPPPACQAISGRHEGPRHVAHPCPFKVVGSNSSCLYCLSLFVFFCFCCRCWRILFWFWFCFVLFLLLLTQKGFHNETRKGGEKKRKEKKEKSCETDQWCFYMRRQPLNILPPFFFSGPLGRDSLLYLRISRTSS